MSRQLAGSWHHACRHIVQQTQPGMSVLVNAQAQTKLLNNIFLLSKFCFTKQPLEKSRKFNTALLLVRQNFSADNIAVQTGLKHESSNFSKTCFKLFIYISLHA